MGTSSKKQANRRNKKSAAMIQRKIAKNWEALSHCTRYKKAVAVAFSTQTTLRMEEELFDGIFLNLNNHNSIKSYKEQKRILRRIVEKRQAQTTHHKVGRSHNRLTNHLMRQSTSDSMKELHRYQFCA